MFALRRLNTEFEVYITLIIFALVCQFSSIIKISVKRAPAQVPNTTFFNRVPRTNS